MIKVKIEPENIGKSRIQKVDSEYESSSLDRSEDAFFGSRIVSSNWLTTNEAAEYLRTSPNQIRNWVYQGKIHPYRLFNKSLRFKTSELDLLIEGGQ